MNKPTKNPRRATLRLAEAIHEKRSQFVRLERAEGGRVVMTLHRNGRASVPFPPKRWRHALVMLVDVALCPEDRGGYGMTKEEVASAINLTRVPGNLAGWEQLTIASVAHGQQAPPPRLGRRARRKLREEQQRQAESPTVSGPARRPDPPAPKPERARITFRVGKKNEHGG